MYLWLNWEYMTKRKWILLYSLSSIFYIATKSSSWLIIFGILILSGCRKFKFITILVSAFSYVSFPILGLINIYAATHYLVNGRFTNYSIMLDIFFNRRISMGYLAIEENGFTLLGQGVEMTHNWDQIFNYNGYTIDNTYVYLFVCIGIFYFILISMGFFLLSKYNSYKAALVILSFSLFCLIEVHSIYLTNSFALLLLKTVLFKEKRLNRRKPKGAFYMIPKIIHYCWFGGNPLPRYAKKYIESWKKYLPDYEIKEWNESNFDLDSCEYVREAYEARKWAFVSDYARFLILYKYGGLYFDTDVEVVKSLDCLVERGPFMGCEGEISSKVLSDINPGLGLAAAPGLGLYKEILDYYSSIHFSINQDGTYDTVVDYVTNILRKHGFKGNGTIEEINGIYIYPPEYFCPMNYRTGKVNITENTYTIHWYTASWQSEYSRMKTKAQHLLGEKATSWIIRIKKMLRNRE